MQQGRGSLLVTAVPRDLLHPPADVGIVILMRMKGHQLRVTAAPPLARTAAFGTVAKGTNLTVIGRAVEEEVADIVEEGTLPQVIVGQLAQTLKGGNIEGVIPKPVGRTLGPAAVDTGPVGIKGQQGLERIGQP